MDFLSILHLVRKRLKILLDSNLIRSSGLFDKAWYLKHNPEVAQTGADPLRHYLLYGGFEGRDPGPRFSSRWYLDAYEDVKESGINPLVHYLRRGRQEQREPLPPEVIPMGPEAENLSLIRSSGFFDETAYLASYPDLAEAGVNPLLHYLYYGGFEGRELPHFYSQWYLDTYEDVRTSNLNPLIHYLKYGQREGRQVTPPMFKLARMYDYSKEKRYLVFEDAPEKIHLGLPSVVGNVFIPLEEGQAECPRPYVSVLPDAVILGGEGFVLMEGSLILNDELVDFDSKEFGKKSTRLKTLPDGNVILKENKKIEASIPEGIFLSGGHDANYFHWLVECLPRLLFMDSLDMFPDVPVLVPSGLHPNLMTALERVNANHRSVILVEPGLPYRVERLIYPSPLSRITDRYEGNPVFNRDIVLSLKWLGKLSQCLKIQPEQEPWRKLFLTRRKGLRTLQNREQLEEVLSNQGFEIVDLGDLSLDDQLELFSEASAVMAPSGAALTNMLFCPPGTKVWIFMPNHEATNFYFWSNLGAVNNLDVTIIVGERLFTITNYWSVHDDYRVDPRLVRGELRKWEQQTNPGASPTHPNRLVERTTPETLEREEKIFVLGPPRSGTTMIYAMIAGDVFLPECTYVSTLLKTFHEIYKYSDAERFEYYAHSQENLAEIFRKPVYDFLYTASTKVAGDLKRRYIYKDPILTLYLQYFRLFFDPAYKVVFCVRDPRDVVTSMMEVLRKQNNKAEDAVLFQEAKSTIFPFYHEIHKIDVRGNYVDREKILFVKYERMVAGDGETRQALEDFLGFEVNGQGTNHSVKGKLDKSSPFFSENYGEAITESRVGKYKNVLTADQIEEVTRLFAYHMTRFDYR